MVPGGVVFCDFGVGGSAETARTTAKSGDSTGTKLAQITPTPRPAKIQEPSVENARCRVFKNPYKKEVACCNPKLVAVLGGREVL